MSIPKFENNHIRMFKQYNVHVGVSMGGPAELNDARWAGTLERTREATAKTTAALECLCNEGIACSLIVTLHRGNATRDKFPVMNDWFRYLRDIGIRSARLHILEIENELVRSKYQLSPQESIDAFLNFAELEKELSPLSFDIFKDMCQMLLGQDNQACCIWNACDPYITRAVRGIEGNGQSSNCGRTNKDGVDFTKSDIESFERYLALYHTPQEFGGCKNCRFFLMCKGQCPGTAIGGDWRNRLEHCEVWVGLYEHLEHQLLKEGLTPFSLRPERAQVEARFMDA